MKFLIDIYNILMKLIKIWGIAAVYYGIILRMFWQRRSSNQKRLMSIFVY
ncbi:hypothetical protein C8P67_105293 [Flavobacterium aquicola]|uniref:Uncharacterized protein n=1 Tax=Flavobacterium aquicola TaxID=1682742 RepID=A0A3E0EN35_9FLAO|nr:hypothetical protein C8P67_105293 [Flavobacterium aquicola]